jgi:hypothetical protein
MSDATVPPDEIGERKEDIPRKDPDIEEKTGHAGEEVHSTFLVSMIGMSKAISRGQEETNRYASL